MDGLRCGVGSTYPARAPELIPGPSGWSFVVVCIVFCPRQLFGFFDVFWGGGGGVVFVVFDIVLFVILRFTLMITPLVCLPFDGLWVRHRLFGGVHVAFRFSFLCCVFNLFCVSVAVFLDCQLLVAS